MKNEEEYLEKRPFISVILILIGFALLSVFWIFIMLIGIGYYALKDQVTVYVYNVGVSLDYLLASLIFGTKGHTISAIVYKRKKMKWIKFINWLFRDKEHCITSYYKEYGAEINE